MYIVTLLFMYILFLYYKLIISEVGAADSVDEISSKKRKRKSSVVGDTMSEGIHNTTYF